MAWSCVWLVGRYGASEPCGRPAEDRQPYSLPLCDRHHADAGLAFVELHWERRAALVQKARDEAEARSVVYFLQRSDGAVKIGYSSRFASRRAALEREHGPLELLGLLNGGPIAEAAMHDRLRRHRLTGEWFAPAEPVLAAAAGSRFKLPGAPLPA